MTLIKTNLSSIGHIKHLQQDTEQAVSMIFSQIIFYIDFISCLSVFFVASLAIIMMFSFSTDSFISTIIGLSTSILGIISTYKENRK